MSFLVSLMLLFALVSLVVPLVSADVPVVALGTTTSGSDTVLVITVTHRDPTTTHRIDRIEVEVTNSSGSATFLVAPPPAPQPVPFIVTFNLGPITETNTVKSKARCTVHGLSNTPTLTLNPQATVPSAPRSLQVNAGDTQASLTWQVPVDDGGSPVTSYRVYRGTSSGAETLLITLGNVLSYVNTGLTNGQTYYYRVSAVNSIGEGAQSNEASAMPVAVPSAPTLISATPSDAQVVLTWSAPSNTGGSAITNYRIYRGVTSGGESFLTMVGNILTYSDTSLTNGQTYHYQVSAVNSIGEGPRSNELSARPIGPPSAPQNLQANPGDAFVNLSWQEPITDGGGAITNYQVWRGSTPGGETFLNNTGLQLWYLDSNLTNDNTYYYTVRAENIQGLGSNSSEVAAIPSQNATAPSAPHDLQATPGEAQVVLTWSIPANNGGAAITNYSIYRGTASGAETLLITIGNVLTYIDMGLTNGQIYYYTVSAVNSAGEGPQSNEVSTIPRTVPSAPQNLQATAVAGDVSLSWQPPSSDGGSIITNYKLYRGTVSGGERLFMELPGDALSTIDASGALGSTYFYTISAVNSAGEGAQSNEASATPVTVPSAPQNLLAIPGNASVSLSWQAPSSNGGTAITSYQVWRSTTSGGETFLASAGLSLTYADAGLTNGQTYYYTVSAVNAQGGGPNSSEATATPIQPPTVPSAPTITSIAAGNGQATLTWSAPSSDGGSAITNYKIYRGTTSGSVSLLTTLGNVTSFVDTGLINGQTYYYEVSASNSAGEGEPSAEGSVIPSAPPSDGTDTILLIAGAIIGIVIIVAIVLFFMRQKK